MRFFSWLLLAAASVFWVQPATAGTNITIRLAGDSTMADKPLRPAHPERGWGQMLPLYFQADVKIDNHAMNGRSTRSFLSEGRWKKLIEATQPGDYVIIQFAHNDEKVSNGVPVTEPFGSFKQNLERFVRDVRERQGVPILATPIARRRFNSVGQFYDTHGEYPAALRQVATEQKVPLLELHLRTSELLGKLGPERSLQFFCHAGPGEYERAPQGLKDDTHLSPTGASRVCDLAVEELAVKVPALATHLAR